MKRANLLLVILVFVSSLVNLRTLEAQEIPNAPANYIPSVGFNTANQNDPLGAEVSTYKSPRQIELENQIRTLRLSDNASNRDELERLNRELERESGHMFHIETRGGIKPISINEPVPYNPTENMFTAIASPSGVRGIATMTELRGSTAGRIWVVAGTGAATGSDTLRFYYSTNNGINWISYALFTMPGFKINASELDAELIESTSGDKYIQVVAGVRADNGEGRWQVRYFHINITTLGGFSGNLTWPGDDANKRYYYPRITSDNASYASFAYTYIVIAFDSIAGPNRINTQKFARCTNPYTDNPVFGYKAERVAWVSITQNMRTLQSDIAYFNNGGADSVIMVMSNVPDTSKLYFAKMDIIGSNVLLSAAQITGGAQPNDQKQLARLSTNGNNNGSVICIFRQFTGTWNVKYFRTVNFGNFANMIQSVFLGSSGNNNTFGGSSVGIRNAAVHYYSFLAWGSSTDTIRHLRIPIDGAFSITTFTTPSLASSFIPVEPGYRLVANDSCFFVYAAPTRIWSGAGCNTIITYISGNETPMNFSLSQNFPNPFNPETRINFSVPNSGLVKLAVYDVLGKEVATLVNEKMEAGNFTVNFNADILTSGVYFYKLTSGEFSEVKRMVLLK